MKKFQIVTLGCRTNQYESQLFSDQLRQIGYISSNDGPIDLCIINTCSVTDHADATSRAQIRKLARLYPEARLIVTGCMAENIKESLHQIDSRIEFFSNKDKERLISNLTHANNEDLGQGIQQFDGHTRAFVKVQDGCNSFCSYCVIPFVRGRSRSRPIAAILKEVETLVANGYREIVLTGVNVGDYDSEGKTLADLVEAVDQIGGLKRLRISSIDPNHVNDRLIQVILNGQCTCPNLHLVLQSGSDSILQSMNRKYRRSLFLDTVQCFQQQNADFTFTTDIIVGFPGETDADFSDTLDVVRRVKFAKVHIFPYSIRSHTRAALFPNHLSPSIIQKRKEQLQSLCDQVAFELRKPLVGRKMEVLLEEGSDEFLSGHTTNFLRVQVPKNGHSSNELVLVQMIENQSLGLIGEIV